MWIPVHWKGWLSFATLIVAVVGILVLGIAFGLMKTCPNVIFAAIVATVIGFQIFVFAHSK
jgi:hypothetical protein